MSSRTGNSLSADQKAWQSQCRELASWAWDRLAIKRDRHGIYSPEGGASWSFSALTKDDLAAHFAGEITLGAGEASTEDQCLWVGWDLDNHSDTLPPDANLSYAIVMMNRLQDLGFRPIVEDSDGRGGIHVWVFFSNPVPCETAHRFVKWVVRDAAEHAIPKVELRPHASTVQTGAKCGLYLRMPGKHHKRDHWSRFWGDGEWLGAADGIEYLLSHKGDNPGLIPAIADPAPPAPVVYDWRSDNAVVERARKYVARKPGAVSGSGGHNQTFHVACCVVKGFELSPDEAFEVLTEWNASCVPPWSEQELRHKIDDARKAPGESGYLRNAKPERWDSIPIPQYVRQASTQQTATEAPRTFAGICASELSTYATQEADWLVSGVFTMDEPLLVGARSKGCKTLQLTDLAVAVGSGTKWMNIFDVPKRRKVLFITGEANYRRIAKHIEKACKVRGLDFADLKGFLRVEAKEFPCLPSVDDQDAIQRDVQAHGFEICIVDPLYRGLSGVDASRLSEMGSAIKNFQAACHPAMMILSHHVVKSAAREYGEPPTLEDMTGAGIAESCGQWWLVGRNEKYAWDWNHDLCVQFGGREGQGGGRRILFNEVAWTFEVGSLHEFREQTQVDQQQRREELKRDKENRAYESHRAKILQTIRKFPAGETKTQIRIAAGQNPTTFEPVFLDLLSSQEIEPCDILKRNQHGNLKTYPGFRLASKNNEEQGEQFYPVRAV